MSMHDPISDFLTRIRNASTARKQRVAMPSSKAKAAIAAVLRDEGYIKDYWVEGDTAKPTLVIELKYFQNRPVIEQLQRVSRPGLRIYRGVGELPKVWGGLGVSIISTSRGVMSDVQARAAGHGGEVPCTVA